MAQVVKRVFINGQEVGEVARVEPISLLPGSPLEVTLVLRPAKLLVEGSELHLTTGSPDGG